jgi:hypothetical protein
MSIKTRILKELTEILWVSLYFFCWFGALMLIKVLLLQQYKIEFYGATIVIVGTLVAAKAVVILEKVPLFKNQPAWLEILLRTILYSAGIALLLILEKGLEARHEYGGFLPAVKNLFETANGYQIWLNTICIFGALFFFNLGTVIKLHLGKDGFKRILRSPVPKE